MCFFICLGIVLCFAGYSEWGIPIIILTFNFWPDPKNPVQENHKNTSDLRENISSKKEFEKILNKQLKTIYSGFRLLKNIFWVGDEHRLHPWSRKPGGCTVVVVLTNGQALGYDKVKRPHRYIKKIILNKMGLKSQWNSIYSRNDNLRIPNLRDYLKGVCITKQNRTTLNLVWDNKYSNEPWSKLKAYATE